MSNLSYYWTQNFQGMRRKAGLLTADQDTRIGIYVDMMLDSVDSICLRNDESTSAISSNGELPIDGLQDAINEFESFNAGNMEEASYEI